MNSLQNLKYYLKKCNITKLLIYLICKHYNGFLEETLAEKKVKEEEIKSRIDDLLNSYLSVIKFLLKTKKKNNEDFIIHVEMLLDKYNNEKQVTIYGVPKNGHIFNKLNLHKLSWDIWLGSDIYWDKILNSNINKHGIEILVAECLYELTFDGFVEKINKEEVTKNDSLYFNTCFKNKTVKDIISGELK